MLKLKELPATITVRYIGYHSQIRTIEEKSSKDQHFSLEPATMEMKAIVVTDRDPALSIMERVIARKQIWREQLQNYRSETYTRTTLRKDTSIVSISETVSEAFWDVDKGHREILKS